MDEKQISTDRQALIRKNQKDILKEELFTDREASRLLRISQVTLWRERRAGKISFQRSGAKVMYTRQNLENYINRSKTLAITEAIAA